MIKKIVNGVGGVLGEKRRRNPRLEKGKWRAEGWEGRVSVDRYGMHLDCRREC
jgi:hypothetical protein